MAFGPSCSRMLNFYPRPPRGGRQLKVKNFNIFLKISIHALREEGDYNDCEIPLLKKVFLSTPSARRATVPNNRLIDNQFAFLSTPSARRATLIPRTAGSRNHHFYPRPPRGGRHVKKCVDGK